MKKAILILGIFCLSLAQTQAQDKVKVELKDGPKPDIYIDGKKYDYAIFELLDQTKIESIDVIKGDQALKEYNAENGVILVVTKQSGVQIRKAEKDTTDIKEKPLIIIDGEIANEDDLVIMNREDVKSIKVLKGKEAMDQYNAPNGVVIITTKQK
ncbi:MAG: hypothetical protein RLO17_22725 [Cyclobacteriaceae bacterium]